MIDIIINVSFLGQVLNNFITFLKSCDFIDKCLKVLFLLYCIILEYISTITKSVGLFYLFIYLFCTIK